MARRPLLRLLCWSLAAAPAGAFRPPLCRLSAARRAPRALPSWNDGDAAARGDPVATATLAWMKEVVVGLGLCPWAAGAFVGGAVRVHASAARSRAAALAEARAALRALGAADAEAATTLLVLPAARDLEAFRDFYAWAVEDVEPLLDELELRGVVQVAHFHPQFEFAGGAARDAPEHFTNRAPWPTLHFLREREVSAALDAYAAADGDDAEARDPARIWQRNVETMRALDAERMRAVRAFAEIRDSGGSAP